MKYIIAAAAVSVALSTSSHAQLTTDYDDGAAAFWASLAESTNNADDFVMFSWLADSAELKMTDEKVQAALDVSDEGSAEGSATIDVKTKSSIESDYEFELIGGTDVPTELTEFGTVDRKLYLTDTYTLYDANTDEHIDIDENLIWEVKPNTAFKNQMLNNQYIKNVYFAKQGDEYTLLGSGSFANQESIEFINGSKYNESLNTIKDGYYEMYISPKAETAESWDEYYSWMASGPIQDVAEPTIAIINGHSGYDVDVTIGDKTVATTFTTLSSNTLNSMLDVIENVAEQAYEAGWEDGYSEGYSDGYSDGFADGVNSVKEQLQ